jgi:hypothetical protein
MSLKSKLKIENAGMFAALTFYAIVGIVSFVMLPIADFPPNIGIIGMLSLITAYGLYKKRAWSIWFVVMLFFIATTFSAVMLYYFVLGEDLIRDTSIVAYLLLTWVFTAYTVAKRKILET